LKRGRNDPKNEDQPSLSSLVTSVAAGRWRHM